MKKRIVQKRVCPKCNNEVSIQNYSRHVNRCDGSGFRYYIKMAEPQNYNCKFCAKECKNLNALRQHECRCKRNPDRRNFDFLTKYVEQNIKGKKASDCESIARQVATMKQKYNNGYKSVSGVRPQASDYIHREHNESEIARWLNYIKNLDIHIPAYSTKIHPTGYKIIATSEKYTSKVYGYDFEQNYIANALLRGKLQPFNTVHHINLDKQDNTKENLLVFQDIAQHARYHQSKYAYLHYNADSHLFTCEIVRNNSTTSS